MRFCCLARLRGWIMRVVDSGLGRFSITSYVDLEVRVGQHHALAGDPGNRERGFGGAGAQVFGAVFADRAPEPACQARRSGKSPSAVEARRQFAGIRLDVVDVAAVGGRYAATQEGTQCGIVSLALKTNTRDTIPYDRSMVALDGTSPHSEAVLAFGGARGARGAIVTGLQ